MDYKKQYLKYKRKYLNIKKTLNKNKMSGGDLSIQIELNNLLNKHKLNDVDFKNCLKEHTKNNLYKNNELEVSPEKNLLVIIYAHWCYHCVNMIKHIGEHLQLDINKNRIKYLDGTTLTAELKQKLEIRGFPTIIKIKNSPNIDNLNKKEYQGPREAAQMIEFLNE